MADDAGGLPGWDPLLTPEEAANLLRCSAKTLERWRSQRVGPEYIKPGGFKVLYLQSALSRFVQR